MEIKDLNKFIEYETDRLDNYYDNKDKSEMTLAVALKVVEEIGELMKEVLSHKGYRRKDKLDKWDIKNIDKEFADVIITVLILAKKFNINIETALETKIEEIKKRVYEK